MRRALIIAVPIVLAAAGGGGWLALSHAEDPLAAANALLRKGDVRGAEITLRGAVRRDPENAEAHFRLAQLQLRLGDPVAAERELKAAASHGMERSTVVLPLAESYLRQGRYADLLRDFPATDLPPKTAAAVLGSRAYAQIALKDLAGAQGSVDQAEQLDPTGTGAPIAAARVAMARQDVGLAMRKLDRALQLNPKDPDALLLQGQLMLGQGDQAGALTRFETAVAAAPDRLDARLMRAGLLLETGGDAKAGPDIDAVLARQPGNGRAVFMQAVLLTRQQHYAQADAALQKIAPVMGELPQAYYYLAIVKAALNQPEQADDAITRFLARNPDNVRGQVLRANILFMLKRFDAAARTLETVVADGHADAATYDLLGRSYALTGRMQQASLTLQHAAQLAPDDASILNRLASVDIDSGHSGDAVSVLAKSLALTPKQPVASEQMVRAAIGAGDFPRATAALDALRKQVGDTETVDNLAGIIRLWQFDIAGARAEFTDMLRRHPDSALARLNLAQVAALAGDRDEQRRMLADLLARDPANTAALTGIVPLLLADGNAAEARRLADAARAKMPDDGTPVMLLAEIDMRSGKPDAALDGIAAALRKQPGNAGLLQVQAGLQLRANRPDAAIASYRQMLTGNPRNNGARLALAGLLMRAKDVEGARSVLRDGVAAAPGDAEMLNALVQIDVANGDLPAALASADVLAQQPANLPAARLLRGNAYLAARRPADAAGAYLAELRRDPTLPLTLAASAALDAAGQPAQAQQVVKDWVDHHPDDLDGSQMLAAIEIERGQLDDAERQLKAVLARRPDDAAALNNLAWVYQQRGRPEAVTVARKAFFLAPSPAMADTLGWIMASNADAHGAVPLLRQAAAGAPDDPRIRYHLAYALNGDGQKSAAVDLLKVLVADKTAFDGQADARKLLGQLTASH